VTLLIGEQMVPGLKGEASLCFLWDVSLGITGRARVQNVVSTLSGSLMVSDGAFNR
jgi:hypothetical protein